MLLGALTPVIVFRPWVEAQVRTAIVLSAASDTPVLSWAVRVATPEPVVREAVVARAPSTVVRPEGRGPWPAIVFVNGATRRGRRHPDVQRLARGLARAGYLVVVPDLPGLRMGEISRRTVRATVDVAAAVARGPEAADDRVSLFGVSVGTTLALLAAEDQTLVSQVRLVAGIAPYTDLREVVHLATTGYHRDGSRLVRYEARPYVALAIARSLVAGLPPGADRRRLVRLFAAVDDDADDPLEVVRRPLRELDGPARALVAVLRNNDPRRFDALYGRLPASMRSGIAALSPLSGARGLLARVELVSAPHDKYFPPAQSRALVDATERSRLTVTTTLAHTDVKPSFRALADLFRFDGFVVRVLKSAR